MDERPNFLVFIVEQHRGDCLSCDGHPVLLTPTMDEIGGRGARFARAYSTCPVCVPARRSFLTGQFPGTHGVFSNASVEWDGPTVASELTRAGYQTAWLGRSMHQTPVRKRHGFELNIYNDHRDPLDDYNQFLARSQPEGSGGYYGTGVMHNDWTARPWHLPEALHHTNWTVNLALDFLRRRDPAGPSPSAVKLTGEALLSTRAGYYGLINHLDDQLHRLLNGVTGVDRMTGRNTVVVLTADHGEMLGDHYLWRKSLPYEGACRIPMLLRAPERFGIGAGTVLDQPVGLEDLMPTMLEMAGVDCPDTVDGRSLLPLLRGEKAPWRPHIQVECAPTFQCLTDGREKYVWFVRDGREQLFDLAADPTECHDLAASPAHAERLAWWRAELVAALAGRPEGFSDGSRLIPGRPYPGARPPQTQAP